VGLTCNSFSSVSLDPPLVSWSLRKASKSIEVFRSTPAFAINILADDQNELSGRFASSRITDKFNGVDWRAGHGGSPVVAHCLASFECRTFAVHDAGDHLVFIGEVRSFEQGRQEEPLVFYKGAYMMLTQSLRDLVARGHAGLSDLHDARTRVYALLVRLACENGTDEEFDALAAQLDLLESYTVAEDIEKRMQAGVRFFRMIAAAAHNEVLSLVADSINTMLVQALKDQIVQARRTAPHADLVNAAVVPLRRKILLQLRARDPEAAHAALDEFMANGSLMKSMDNPVQ
jgi:flavin reductase (DIM6/NTAB) family NADH-FMN oxidoreductase RutF